MENLKYRIENCLKQAEAIKQEYPKVNRVDFDITGCKYEEILQVSEERGSIVDIHNGVAIIVISEGIAKIFVFSNPLIVSEPIIVEG